jgi:hypothetical protein
MVEFIFGVDETMILTMVDSEIRIRDLTPRMVPNVPPNDSRAARFRKSKNNNALKKFETSMVAQKSPTPPEKF